MVAKNRTKEKTMKNQNKKSKRIQIECIGDLMDALVNVEESENRKLSDAYVGSTVSVEEGVDVVNVKSDDKIVFSMRVTDENASAAFGALKDALERARKALMPKVESPEVVTDVIPHDNTRKPFKRMDADGFNKQLNAVVENANSRLVEIRGGSDIKDVVIAFAFDGGRCIVRSGDREIADEITTDDIWGSFKRCRAAIWQCVDDAKPAKARRTFERFDRRVEKPVEDKHDFAHKFQGVVDSANEKLREIGENELSVESDVVGFYVKSGTLPVASLPKGVGSADEALAKITEKVWSFVNSAKGAAERHKQISERAAEVEADSQWDMSFVKKANPEADESKPWTLGPNPEMASAIVKAVNDAVSTFNRSLLMMFGEVSDLLGGKEEMRLTAKGFTRGIVVSCGKSPCLVTMFPLVANNKTTEESVAFVTAKIAAIGESRTKLYQAVAAEHARQEKLRSISEKRAALDEELKAMAM